MAKPRGLVGKRRSGRFVTERRAPAYRAVTLGADRDDWAVVDGQGEVVFRGDARIAAMIANRLTRPVA